MFAFLVVVGLFGIALLSIYLMACHVQAGLFSLLAANFLNLTFGLNATAFGRLHLNLVDAVYIGLLIAGVCRSFRGFRFLNATRILTVGYLLVFASSFARGISANGVFAAGNEARGFVGPLLAMLYFLDAPADEKSVRRYVHGFLVFGAALCVVAALAAAGLPVGVSAWAKSAVAAADNRYLPSSAAAAIGVCGFLALARSSYHGHSFVTELQAPAFFLVAIYLRHRTVWMLLLAGTAALLFVDGRLFRRILPAALLALIAVVGIAFLENGNANLAGEDEFSASVSNANTWYWRVNGWQEFLFDSDQTPFTVLMGKPIGSGWWRIDPLSHLAQTAPPHSEYVTEYLRAGMIGLFFLMCFLLGPFIALWRVRKEWFVVTYPCTSIWIVVVFITLVYGVTYSIEPESYALFGIASAIAFRARTPQELPAPRELAPWGMDSSVTFAK
jgi:hypothetical protein